MGYSEPSHFPLRVPAQWGKAFSSPRNQCFMCKPLFLSSPQLRFFLQISCPSIKKPPSLGASRVHEIYWALPDPCPPPPETWRQTASRRPSRRASSPRATGCVVPCFSTFFPPQLSPVSHKKKMTGPKNRYPVSGYHARLLPSLPQYTFAGEYATTLADPKKGIITVGLEPGQSPSVWAQWVSSVIRVFLHAKGTPSLPPRQWG